MKGQRARSTAKRRREVYVKKITIAVITLFLVLGFSIILGSNFANAEDNSDTTSVQHKYYKSIVIESGDTLWGIAKEYKDAHYSSTYDYIDELMEINNLNTDEIHAGQYLTVSYYDSL